eukprot:CAMPEP_0113580142 /NCGR_PEP_ID=MMETSP0015_2-20120614/30494_1 /TAXON_ID=2838 /ORGANISM="Odontella" /LENGTH=271 /DNA_ID=CAMNT_0000484269 /DNA_START=5 /DNA_END=817 /DNA_ORIENTATION=- /assembly_acc=CAM_ASM_000160
MAKYCLYPLRIDALSTDGSARLVDTLLVDPLCLPVPIASTPLDDAIEENVRFVADGLISDMEVHSAVRTAKGSHFSGRVDVLGKPGLREKVEDQIRGQIKRMLKDLDGPRVLEGEKDSVVEEPPFKKRKVDAPSSSSACDEVSSSALAPSEKRMDEKSRQKGRLVPIKIRLRENNVVVLDEFQYDILSPPMPGGDPISIAKGIVRDLNLPQDMAVSIATLIVDQIHGLDVGGSLEGMDRSRAKGEQPAAWTVDSKEVAAAQTQVLSYHNLK